jgi:hypothetical protein
MFIAPPARLKKKVHRSGIEHVALPELFSLETHLL